jgi:thiamine-phosphate pyrophosphorylase
MFSKLQYISQGETPKEQFENIQKALNAGCDWIQLRFKQEDELSKNYFAEKVKKECERYYASLIINDFAHIAKRIDADGVHVGLDDASVSEVREIIGPKGIIGGTANTVQHVMQRFAERCDYVGLGPYRFTTTKEKLSPTLGLEGYQKIANTMKEMGVSIPVYAIGGIELEDVEGLMDAGIHGVALSGGITKSQEQLQFVKNINKALYASTKNS